MRWFPFILSLLFCAGTQAQDTKGADDTINEIMEQLADENEEEGIDLSACHDDLHALSEQPLDLNTATREQLEQLVFLSDIQIENLLYYRYQFGDMHSVYELRLVEGLDEQDIRRMLPFVTIGKRLRQPEKLYAGEVFRHGKNDLYLRLGGNLEQAQGYHATGGRPRAYAGSPLHHQLKYRFRYNDRIHFRLSAEKDAGEPFFTRRTGYDFFSAYAQANDIGRFKTIVLGDFRANFGEGLVMRTNFSMGRSSQVLNMNRPPGGLRKSTSTDEYNFFRGLGTTVRLGQFDVTAFYSYRKIDGDTAGGTFTGINRTGLHRTELERSRKRTVGRHVAGGDITFTRHHLQVGLTAVHTSFSHALVPDPNAYNAVYFHGRRQTTAGLHYRMRLGGLNFFGETAMTNGFAAATVNGFSFMPASRIGLVVQHRYLSPRYDSFYTRIFGNGSSQSRNEHGVYIGTEAHPFRHWKFSMYADVARHPWLKHGASSPTAAADYLLNADFTPRRDWWMYWRVRYRQKGINDTHALRPAEEIVPHDKWTFRYGMTRVYGNFRFQTLLYGNLVKRANEPWTYGVSALQDIGYTFDNLHLRIELRYQFFDAQTYDNGIYSYEHDVLHAFSIPMHYGIGSRYYLNIKYSPLPWLSLWLKAAQTAYADLRETTGTGHDTTPGNRRTTLRLLARFSW